MSQIAEQKCPACGAPLRFDPASGKLVCDYCGTVVDLQAEAAEPAWKPSQDPSQEHLLRSPRRSLHKRPHRSPLRNGLHRVEQSRPDLLARPDRQAVQPLRDLPALLPDPVNHLRQAVQPPCVSCGAEVIAPAEQMALTCPYCGNNIVLTEKVSGKLRPDGVIPFRIPAKDLPKAMNNYYKDKKLLPRHFFSESTMSKVTGVYVPFWVFSGDVDGTLHYKAQTSSSSRHGDYIITQTNHYQLVREAALSFDRLPVDASGKIEDRLMDSLEPFHMSEMQPFDMRYLAGFTADRFDQKKADMSERASKRMKSTTHDLVNAQAAAGYGSVTYTGGRLNAKLDAKYILFPVYMFDISHAGKKYHFAVNGQTGKVVGDLPTDSSVSTLYFLKRVLIVGGSLFAFSVLKYMLGM